MKGLALKPAEPTPLHLLLRVYLRLEDEQSCADAFWLYWPRMSGNHLRVAGKQEQDERFGDGWAWDEWDGMKDRNVVAGIMECVATCFAGLQRFVKTPINAHERLRSDGGVTTAHGMAKWVQRYGAASVNTAYGSAVFQPGVLKTMPTSHDAEPVQG